MSLKHQHNDVYSVLAREYKTIYDSENHADIKRKGEIFSIIYEKNIKYIYKVHENSGCEMDMFLSEYRFQILYAIKHWKDENSKFMNYMHACNLGVKRKCLIQKSLFGLYNIQNVDEFSEMI